MWEVALTAHVLLEGGRGGAPAVDLPVEDDDDEERFGEGLDVRLHHRWLEGARKGPAHVARRVAHVCAYRGGAARHVEVERTHDARQHLRQARGQQ